MISRYSHASLRAGLLDVCAIALLMLGTGVLVAGLLPVLNPAFFMDAVRELTSDGTVRTPWLLSAFLLLPVAVGCTLLWLAWNTSNVSQKIRTTAKSRTNQTSKNGQAVSREGKS